MKKLSHARIDIRMDCLVDVLAYEHISQHYDFEQGCWVENEPQYMRLEIGEIVDVHEATEEELREYVCTDVKFPTEICAMHIIPIGTSTRAGERYRYKSVLIAGSLKEWQERLTLLRKKYGEISHEFYYGQIREIEKKFDEELDF